MNYVELNIAISDAERAEILIAELADYPFESFMTDPKSLKAYIPEQALTGCKSAVDAMLNSFGVMRRSYTPVATKDWNAAWESSFEPVDVDGKLVIRAPFHAPAPTGIAEVVIMPHLSFGTGHHATTCLMTSTLLKLDVKDKFGLDVGSGTGVLSIVAAKQGATAVDAVDIDDWADENCRMNATTNGVANRVHTLLGDVHRVEGHHYDFILANINRNVLLADLPCYNTLLNAGGTLLMSGFLEADAPIVAQAAEAQGLHTTEVCTRDGWALIHCTKS
ncbi:MAG: 50S ribosomal protein L11 methyltransferase [Alistipes sp.]